MAKLRKLLTLLFFSALFIGFSGCVSESLKDNDYSIRKLENGLVLKVFSIQKTLFYIYPSEGNSEVFTPKKDFFLVVANVSIENKGANKIDFPAIPYYLADSNGSIYSANILGDSTSLIVFQGLNPGESIIGRVYFELPWNSTPDRMVFLVSPDELPLANSSVFWALLDEEKKLYQKETEYLELTRNE